MKPIVIVLLTLLIAGGPALARDDGAECAGTLVPSLRAEFGIPGMAVAVRRGDTLVFNRGFGLAHVETGEPVTPSTIFQLSSSAKMFTGVLTMRLVEQGVLGLHDSVRQYLPDAPSGWQPVTIRHLVAMIARLPDLMTLERKPGDTRDDLELLQALANRGADDLLAALYEADPDPKPNTGWRYGGGDFFVLQQIIEKVTGKPYEQVMRELVFRPAGMVSTGYWGTDQDVLPGSATDYYPNGRGGLEQRHFVFPQLLYSAGGAASSAEDLLRLDRVLRDNRLMRPETRKAMWTWQPLADGNVVSYGLGWDLKDHAPKQYSEGHSGGYLTTFRHYDTGDLTVVMLTNGFTVPYDRMAPDNIATAIAAAWEPAIIGFDQPACSFKALEGARF